MSLVEEQHGAQLHCVEQCIISRVNRTTGFLTARQQYRPWAMLHGCGFHWSHRRGRLWLQATAERAQCSTYSTKIIHCHVPLCYRSADAGRRTSMGWPESSNRNCVACVPDGAGGVLAGRRG
jgi:hypothetical protein